MSLSSCPTVSNQSSRRCLLWAHHAGIQLHNQQFFLCSHRVSSSRKVKFCCIIIIYVLSWRHSTGNMKIPLLFYNKRTKRKKIEWMIYCSKNSIKHSNGLKLPKRLGETGACCHTFYILKYFLETVHHIKKKCISGERTKSQIYILNLCHFYILSNQCRVIGDQNECEHVTRHPTIG